MSAAAQSPISDSLTAMEAPVLSVTAFELPAEAALPLVTPTPSAAPAGVATLAVPPAAPAALGGMAPASGSWTMVGSLVLVLGLIVLLGRGVRMLQGRQAGGVQPALKLRGSLQVGSRERVVWMQAGETHLLLGVAAGRVNNLHVFEVPPDFDAPEAASAVGAPVFAERLRQVLDRARQRAASAVAPAPNPVPAAATAAVAKPLPAAVAATAPAPAPAAAAAPRPAAPRFRSAA